MKRLLIGPVFVLTLGLAPSAHPAATILFDQTGAGGPGIAVDNFDWAPDNSLVIGTFSEPIAPDGSKNLQVVAQGKLGNFTAPGNMQVPVTSGEFTFQASFFEKAANVSAVPGTTAILSSPGTGASAFTIFHNNVAGVANQITGADYDAGTPILTGTLAGLTGSFIQTGSGPVLLDQLNADNQNGTQTTLGNGSTTIQVNVNFANSAFFRTDVTSLLIDLQDTSNAAVPFITANPSNQVVGFTPFYSLSGPGGFRFNGFSLAGFCPNGSQDENGNPSTRCDLHLQTDGSTSFNTAAVPEPASLALLGAAFAAASLVVRRKKSLA